MARRTIVESGSESDGESTSTAQATRVKEARKVKEGKAGKGKSKARAPTEEASNDGEDMYADAEPTRGQRVSATQRTSTNGNGHYSEDEDAEEGSPRGNKRQRVNGAGESRPTASPGPSGTQDIPRPKTLPRGVDGFIPGSIVRIQLKNFLTYDYVEFRPGPYLNMIIGPNGTGKSTIACAIAIGLNFPPKILGRASELNMFVKTGADAGYTEIELKGMKGKGNLVIRRSLSSKDRKSSFMINGESATGKEVQNYMLELNVQVENLCSFLPQDKVSSFAAMTPQQLLVETQKAAGDPNLTSWFETLKEEGKAETTLKQKHKEDRESCDQMIERNQHIERDVERFKEKRKIEKEIAYLEVVLPYTRYRELRDEFQAAKKKQRKLHAKVKRLKERNAPAHTRLEELSAEVEKLGQKRTKFKEAIRKTLGEMRKQYTDNEKLEADSESIINKLGDLKREEKARISSMKAKEAEITKAEEKLAVPPPDVGTSEQLTDQLKQVNLEKSTMKEEFNELTNELKIATERKVRAELKIQQAQNSIRKLEEPEAKKLNHLQRWDSDAYEAVLWLRQNKHLFKMQVFEPPILSVSVKNMEYAPYVEACFSGPQMKTFVAQCQEDIDTLNYHINDTTRSGGKRIRIATWYRVVHQTPQPPLSPEEMQEIGFEGYALDYLDYPAGMTDFLSNEVGLHRTPISRRPNIDVGKSMEYVGRAGGGNFINGFTMNNVTRSRYGRRALGNVTRDFGPAKNFIVPPVDTTQQQWFQDQIKTAQIEVDEAKARQDEINPQLDRLREEEKEYKVKAEEIQRKRQMLSKYYEGRNKLNMGLRRIKNELENLRNAPSAEEERAKLKAKLMSISKKRMKIAKDCLEYGRKLLDQQRECTQVSFRFIQVSANRDALKLLCDKKDAKHQQAAAEFVEMHKQYTELKNQAHEHFMYLANLGSTLEPELQSKVKDMETKYADYQKKLKRAREEGLPEPSKEGVELRTMAEVEDALANLKASMEMITHTNPGVLEEYEKRKRDIEQLEKTIEQTAARIAASDKKIKSCRDKWQPALQKLVASIGQRFSAAFDRIGCAGEIRIREEEDYEQWAIEIYVKFRDTEKLQLLTGQRQSGGERSLTTILYLMSLTEEARAPFSLVDEINQGMDQRAERVVHNSMVDVTCKEDSGQYFLITPKLLTDLKYHERMKILCVNNGEWLPEERGLGNMMSMIEGFVQQRAKGQARGGRSDM